MEPTTDPFTGLANRLFASWRTSLLAVIIVATVLTLGLTGTVSWEKLWGWLSGPLVILLMKDPAVTRKEKEQAVAQAVEDCKAQQRP